MRRVLLFVAVLAIGFGALLYLSGERPWRRRALPPPPPPMETPGVAVGAVAPGAGTAFEAVRVSIEGPLTIATEDFRLQGTVVRTDPDGRCALRDLRIEAQRGGPAPSVEIRAARGEVVLAATSADARLREASPLRLEEAEGVWRDPKDPGAPEIRFRAPTLEATFTQDRLREFRSPDEVFLEFGTTRLRGRGVEGDFEEGSFVVLREVRLEDADPATGATHEATAEGPARLRLGAPDEDGNRSLALSIDGRPRVVRELGGERFVSDADRLSAEGLLPPSREGSPRKETLARHLRRIELEGNVNASGSFGAVGARRLLVLLDGAGFLERLRLEGDPWIASRAPGGEAPAAALASSVLLARGAVEIEPAQEGGYAVTIPGTALLFQAGESPSLLLGPTYAVVESGTSAGGALRSLHALGGVLLGTGGSRALASAAFLDAREERTDLDLFGGPLLEVPLGGETGTVHLATAGTASLSFRGEGALAARLGPEAEASLSGAGATLRAAELGFEADESGGKVRGEGAVAISEPSLGLLAWGDRVEGDPRDLLAIAGSPARVRLVSPRGRVDLEAPRASFSREAFEASGAVLVEAPPSWFGEFWEGGDAGAKSGDERATLRCERFAAEIDPTSREARRVVAEGAVRLAAPGIEAEGDLLVADRETGLVTLTASDRVRFAVRRGATLLEAEAPEAVVDEATGEATLSPSGRLRGEGLEAPHGTTRGAVPLVVEWREGRATLRRDRVIFTGEVLVRGEAPPFTLRARQAALVIDPEGKAREIEAEGAVAFEIPGRLVASGDSVRLSLETGDAEVTGAPGRLEIGGRELTVFRFALNLRTGVFSADRLVARG